MRFFLLQNKPVHNQYRISIPSGKLFPQTFKVFKTSKVPIRDHLFLNLTGFQNPLGFLTVTQAYRDQIKDISISKSSPLA